MPHTQGVLHMHLLLARTVLFGIVVVVDGTAGFFNPATTATCSSIPSWSTTTITLYTDPKWYIQLISLPFANTQHYIHAGTLHFIHLCQQKTTLAPHYPLTVTFPGTSNIQHYEASIPSILSLENGLWHQAQLSFPLDSLGIGSILARVPLDFP